MRIVRYRVNTAMDTKYTIALISDLHGMFHAEILQSLKSENPDIIAIVGDFVDSSLQDNSEAISFLKECANICFTALSLGNHDYLICENDFHIMKNQGVHVLNDTWERFNSEIVLGGLTSSFYHKCEHYDPKVPMKLYPNTNWLNLFEKQNGYRILLDHHPENYDQYTRMREIDLILSGHNHGGQIRLLGKGVYARNQGLFPKYDGGIFDNRLIVSRGLSSTLPIPRFWNPIELVYIDLLPRQKTLL